MVAGLMVFGASAPTAVAITIVGRSVSYALSTAMGVALAVLGGPSLVRAVTRTASDVVSAFRRTSHGPAKAGHYQLCRGRDDGHPPPPAQNRTCRFTASGSHLG
jgi:hypothetical protein